jgi:pimeloyl-ACP methyl ester carboxylesterase
MGDFPVAARKMTAHLEGENAVVFVDRAGYGLSDDTGREMTLEKIVEDYRTALKNAGIEPPYVLLAHSIGGMYASWWASKYPDEIEAVVQIDGTQLSETAYEDEPDNSPVTFEDKVLAFLARIGFSRYILRSEHYLYPDSFTEEDQALGDALELMTTDSIAPVSESGLRRQNARSAWSGIVPNDIPKLYLCSSWGAQTKEDLIETGQWINRQILKNRLDLPLPRTDFDNELAEKILKQMKDLRRTVLEPYAEKMGGCEIVLLPGDHIIYEQKPDACARLIKNFLDSLPAPPD